MDALGQLLFGKVRGGVLSTLYSRPEEMYALRPLARCTGANPGTVQRELATLLSLGLVESERKQDRRLYWANRAHPVFPELQALLLKTVGVIGRLQSSLASFAPLVEFALVYGSFARGEENAHSDVDLLIVGEVSLDALLEILAPLEQQTGRSINPVMYGREELRNKLRAGNHFLKAMQRGPLLFLLGEENVFRQIG